MKHVITLISLFVVFVLSAASASAQTTQFTHHGNIGFAANGNGYDIQLTLFDTPTVGTGAQQGAAYQQLGVQMTDGEFTVQPDFGPAVFTGAELYLETGWRVSGGGAFTVLPNRERITAVFANRSLSAATADSATNATQLGGLPPSGFLQNTTSQQTGGFNVAGDGTAGGTLSGGTVNATTQFNLGGSRILSIQGYDNLFAGIDAGTSNTRGTQNAFFGSRAGSANTEGYHNSFFGYIAGNRNTRGVANSFFGSNSGDANTEGSYNSFFGVASGDSNTTGSSNSFFGSGAGAGSNGSSNAFFGYSAGALNRAENENTFIGASAGYSTGGYDPSNLAHLNTFVGSGAGAQNSTGSRNTVLGARADFASYSLNNATAIGANAFVGQSNSLVLGSINGVNGATTDTKVGIGITAPGYRLHVIDPLSGGLRVQTNSAGGAVASFGGNGDFLIDAPFVPGGRLMVKESGFIGIGTAAPQDKLDVFGFIRLSQLGSGGSQTLCRNSSNQISTCSSSLRYKTNLALFSGGLGLVNRLQPITFNWKANGEADLGLGAEDVARIEPLLVTHNEKGEVEGVKYDRVSVVLINAFKEQQEQLEQYRWQLSQQQAEIAALKRLVCAGQPDAEPCKPLPSTNTKVSSRP